MIKYNIQKGEILRNVFVFDLDGTLADHSHRFHLMPTENLDLSSSWLEFVNECDKDKPIQNTISVLNALYNTYGHFYVVILTARSEEVQEKTEDWLCDHGVNYDNLIMRDKDDNSKDSDFKERELRKLGLENIVGVWEDNPHVIKRLRDIGLTVYQVCEADAQRTDLQDNGQEK